MTKEKKVFGIGLSRTGTTSLTSALSALGYKSKHYPSYTFNGVLKAKINEFELENYDALTDAPVAYLFKSLDEKYPNSKFILTYRSDEDWLHSATKFFTRPHGRNSNGFIIDVLRCLKPKNKKWRNGYIMRHCVYGGFKFNGRKYLKHYQKHNQEVLKYFAKRKQDLLVVDLTKEQNKWDKLSRFLGKDIPEIPFPHANNSKT